ncbi:MAG: hypothetical protein IPP31_00015 [Chitinophagaceae bacterium]|nr:hypothetical protein [Chitinophagaceae bacterium]
MSDLSIYKIIIYVSCFVAAIVFFLTSNDINFGKEVTEMTIEILITTVVSIIIIIILKSGRELTDEKVIQNNKLLEQQKENDTLILYLRDFAVDGIKIKKLHVGNIKTEFMDTNFETELSLIVSRVGRLIAVGINSPAGDVGSYRYHTNDVNWKKEVSYLMQKSSMILLRPAYSPGLIWELEEIVKNGYLPKTVICYNKRQDGILNYSDFRYATKRFIKLPPFIFVSRYMWFNDQLKLQKLSFWRKYLI